MLTTTPSRHVSRLIHIGLLAGLLLAIPSVVGAATLTANIVRAKGTTGGALAGAQVCISGSFTTRSTTTNGSGSATFANAPQGEITLTVSAGGFLGQSIQFTMGAADKTESFVLQQGSGGPICTPVPPPATLSTLVLSPASVKGGTASQGTLTLSGSAPTGGTAISLSSNNASAATVPQSVNVSDGSNSTTFTVSTHQVSASTPVSITASSGGTTRTATLTVTPPQPPATASLTVLVGRANSTVISGAAVCIAGSTASTRSAFTDIAGQATFNDIPQGQVTITVSSSGFTGQSHASTLPAGGGTARFILSEGSGGPACAASAPPPSSTPATLAITSFDWHVNRRTPLFFEIALAFAASRTPGGPVVPTHFRIGEISNLNGVPWIAYQGGVPPFQLGYRGNSLTAYGQRTLFLQLKQDDLISLATSKSVDLRSLVISEFRLEGLALSEMLRLAESQRIPLRTRTVSVTQNVCGSIVFRLNTLDFDVPSGSLKDQEWVSILEAALTDSSAKRFTTGWRVKSIEIPQSPDPPNNQTITGASDGNGFKVTIRLSAARDPHADPGFCLQNIFALRAIVVEGPGDDMTLDQTKRWKNMFPPN